jgi:peptidoglycan hydrolase-like protein with peptidoglycan-binding domain
MYMKKIIFASAFAFILILQGFSAVSASAQYACTMDAMICPDGSAVGRTGPNCQFVCPGTPSPVYPQVQCPQLSYNLYAGLSDYRTGGQVSQLQQFLSTLYPQAVTGYLGSMTRGNIATFQREQGVYPITGGVGPLTRAAIARVCGGTVIYPTPTTLSITGVSGPTQLVVGQSGTWQVQVLGTGTYLSYSVVWGDEYVYGYGASAAPKATLSTGSLSHTYTQAGTYTPRFTVTNQLGQSVSASATVVVSGVTTCSGINCSTNFTASPTFGYAPLHTAFTVSGEAGSYKIDFGDGTTQQITIPAIYCITTPCNPPPQTVYHTYGVRGTYTAHLMNDYACFYTEPRCMVAVRDLGSVVVTAY